MIWHFTPVASDAAVHASRWLLSAISDTCMYAPVPLTAVRSAVVIDRASPPPPDGKPQTISVEGWVRFPAITHKKPSLEWKANTKFGRDYRYAGLMAHL